VKGAAVAEIALNESQKNVVRRYVQTWRRLRPGVRSFAELESDMESHYEVVVDGITVDNRPGRPVIAADAKDDKFFDAIFRDDDDAVFDMGTEELEQARLYILHGEGTIPVHKWRHPGPGASAAVITLCSSSGQR
jgi:hypothetical protein